ncbi:MAG: hypothetical protein AB7E85_09025 [Pseudobdellovibrionaceae bacterium]
MKYSAVKMLIAMMFGLLLLIGAGGAHAQDGDLKPLSDETKMSPVDFIKQTQMVSETPEGDKYLAFKVRLPQGWQKTEVQGEKTVSKANKLLGEFARYASPPQGDKYAYFSVRALEIDYFISTENWFRNFARLNGYTISGFDVRQENRVAAEYVVFQDGAYFLVRAVVQRNGNRMVLAEFMIPPGMEGDMRSVQIYAMKSFRLETRDPDNPVAVKAFGLLDYAQFSYPADWEAGGVGEQTLDQMMATVQKVSQSKIKKLGKQEKAIQDGVVDAYYFSKRLLKDPKIRIEALKADLGKRGFEVGEVLDTHQINDKRAGYVFHPVETYKLTVTTGKYIDYELWIGVVETEGSYFIVTMVSPTRDIDFLEWARNIATFDIVLRSYYVF